MTSSVAPAGPASPAPVTPVMAALARSDFLRAPVLAFARPEGYQEWQHFVVHKPGCRLLVNFSLGNEPLPGRPLRLAPRVVVIADTGRWTGTVQRFDPTELAVSADLGTLTIGRNTMRIGADGYQVTVDLPDARIRGAVRFTPTTRPFVVTNRPAGAGRLSWLLVPRLRATGWFHLGGVEHRLTDEPAYHDHNWGRFHWGEDVSWEWMSVLTHAPDTTWSFVLSRVTDRRRLRSGYQALCVWRQDELVGVYRDAAVRVRSGDPTGRPPDCTLPPPMSLALGGVAAPVPALVEVSGTRRGETVTVGFRTERYARLARPSQVDLDRSVVLYEAGGSARVSGSVGGETLDLPADGLLEVLHG